MDGGLADNIGLRSVINAYEQSNGFISRNLPAIERLAVIAVNARTESKDTISDCRHTPHIIPTVAMATATISMDNYSFDTVDFADRLVRDLRQAELLRSQCRGKPAFHAPMPYVIEISFEAIPDPKVRAGPLPDLQVRAAQIYLTYKGFAPGAVDGALGPKTVAAVKAFQASIPVEQTGVIDAVLRATLSS
jgi:hypothetical protein